MSLMYLVKAYTSFRQLEDRVPCTTVPVTHEKALKIQAMINDEPHPYYSDAIIIPIMYGEEG